MSTFEAGEIFSDTNLTEDQDGLEGEPMEYVLEMIRGLVRHVIIRLQQGVQVLYELNNNHELPGSSVSDQDLAEVPAISEPPVEEVQLLQSGTFGLHFPSTRSSYTSQATWTMDNGLEDAGAKNGLCARGSQCAATEPNFKMELALEFRSPEKCCNPVPCRYASSGCRDLVNPCTVSEMNHMKSCNFRPIECIVGGCDKDVPCHSFLIHLNQHFIYPVYGSKLTTSVIIRAEDFLPSQTRGGTWLPKWLSTQNRHFFLMLRRFEQGIWAVWVWTLGNDSEAQEFICKISLFKNLKCITGIHPVHSIRTSREDVMKSENCLLISDAVMKSLTGIEDNLVADLAFNVQVLPRTDDSSDDDTEEQCDSNSVCIYSNATSSSVGDC